MKKALVVILALALSIGAVSFAMASDDNSAKTPPSQTGKEFKALPKMQMTDEQKAQMISLKTQMLELQKRVIQENAANGTITQDQADKMIERIDAHLEAIKSGEFAPNGDGFNFKGGKGPRGSFKHKGQDQSQGQQPQAQ